jgi:8-oxo-dGTP pyrophosphatase MutT (NUDIX family)
VAAAVVEGGGNARAEAPAEGAVTLRGIAARLAGTRPRHAPEEWLVPGQSPERSRELRAYFPAAPAPAAVLVPLVDHPQGPTVLLTRRGRGLRNHAGQVSFPGGQIDAEDADPAAAALREAHEEIGLEARFVSVIGYLPDHVVISGFRVTPVVARVAPGFELTIASDEVDAVFEAPLAYLFDVRNHRSRRHRFRGTDVEVELIDIPYGEHNIWGATAGMLMTLQRLCRGELGRGAH